MKICTYCKKPIDDNSVFCKHCGSRQSDSAPTPAPVIKKERKKIKLTKKHIIAIIGTALLTALTITIIVCEVKIATAKELYYMGEYWDAYREVRNIPTLGRESLTRIKTAAWAGEYYESYKITKRIRLDDASRYDLFDFSAYRDAFWELMFGLHMDLQWIDYDSMNAIEIDEYERFIEMHYRELESEFYMSKEEADRLCEKLEFLDDIDDMKSACNDWLEENFFVYD